jgi:hypothetical protein
MQNRVEPNNIVCLDIPHIFVDQGDLANFAPCVIRAARVQITVETGDGMARTD